MMEHSRPRSLPAPTRRRHLLALAGGLLALWMSAPQPAHALPSYARQTGEECAACHVAGFGPQLTPFGIEFKLNGYTETNGKDGHVPLSAMLVGSWTHTAKDLSEDAGPHDGTNDNLSLQEASLFVAGALSEHVGSFVQTTYSDIDRKYALDNLDVRYAQPFSLQGKEALFGVTVNNNPGVTDPFNTLGAWRFPYVSSELAPTPAASPLIDGGLEHQVLGVSAYGLYDGSFYGELGGYRSLSASTLNSLGIDDEAGKLDNLAPYWRLAYLKSRGSQAYSMGLFGMQADLLPDRVPGKSDGYTDVGVDGGLQFLGSRKHIFTLNGSYVFEDQSLDATYADGGAENRSNSLRRFDLAASYFYDQTYGFTASLFDIRGDRDHLLYAPEPDSGSRTGSPDSSGLTLQADWTPFGREDSWGAPWANLRLGLQYTMYDQFNGASNNYDGYGRNAGDNDTLFAFLWAAF